MMFTVMAALAEMELEITRERLTDSVARRRAAGKDLGGWRQTFTDFQIRNAIRLIDSGSLRPRSPATSGCFGRPCVGGFGSCPPVWCSRRR
jgi:DNA invertase Pin-like site-specific DNA recombinase